jgi:hypothetical protein
MKTVTRSLFKTSVVLDNCVNYHCVKFQLSKKRAFWVISRDSCGSYDFSISRAAAILISNPLSFQW